MKIRPEKNSGLYRIDTRFTHVIVQRNTVERHFTFKKLLSLTGLLHVYINIHYINIYYIKME